jgi:2',3'-cyclic-nucleotide 2'-phosphodiesterase (5'-nucleotidase family)
MRVTKTMLENKVDYLNKITNSPRRYCTTDNLIGHFCISGAYGGYELQRVCNNGGGVTTPLNTGHIPKKELYNLISAFIDGILFNSHAVYL